MQSYKVIDYTTGRKVTKKTFTEKEAEQYAYALRIKREKRGFRKFRLQVVKV